MTKRIVVFLVTAVAVGLCTRLAWAQSSGNFTYGTNANSVTACTVSSKDGSISGGMPCGPSACTVNPTTGLTTCTGQGSGLCVGNLGAAIKTNSGSGNVFVVRPSAVVALLTDVSLEKSSTVDIGTSSAYAGVDFQVTVTPPSGAPAPNVYPNYPITYAARFIQISSNLFDVIASQCEATAGGCFLTFNESTASAHSFDWIVGPDSSGSGALVSGSYGIMASWSSSLGNTGISESETCVGPVNLTVEQNKIFHFNTVN